MSVSTAKATAILRDLTQVFDASARAAQPFYPRVCNIVPSKRSDEKYGWLGSANGVREWLGLRQFASMRAATYVLKNKLWEDSLSLDKTDLDDDIMGLMDPAFAQLGAEAALHPDSLLF